MDSGTIAFMIGMVLGLGMYIIGVIAFMKIVDWRDNQRWRRCK